MPCWPDPMTHLTELCMLLGSRIQQLTTLPSFFSTDNDCYVTSAMETRRRVMIACLPPMCDSVCERVCLCLCVYVLMTSRLRIIGLFYCTSTLVTKAQQQKRQNHTKAGPVRSERHCSVVCSLTLVLIEGWAVCVRSRLYSPRDIPFICFQIFLQMAL